MAGVPGCRENTWEGETRLIADRRALVKKYLHGLKTKSTAVKDLYEHLVARDVRKRTKKRRERAAAASKTATVDSD